MERRNLYLFGFIGPVIFILNAILGGLLRPGYNHLTDTVSKLFAVGSPNRLMLSILYLMFSISLILFGFGLQKYVRSIDHHQRLGSTGAKLFILVGVLNILTATVFPQDPWGTSTTFRGDMHQMVSGIITILSLIYILFFGIWFRRTGIFKPFFGYSILTIVLASISSAWFMISVNTPIMGLTERIAILIGFQWTIVLAILILKKDPDLESESSQLVKKEA
jgi:hypothetical membrane protein